MGEASNYHLALACTWSYHPYHPLSRNSSTITLIFHHVVIYVWQRNLQFVLCTRISSTDWWRRYLIETENKLNRIKKKSFCIFLVDRFFFTLIDEWQCIHWNQLEIKIIIPTSNDKAYATYTFIPVADFVIILNQFWVTPAVGKERHFW